MKIIKTSKIKEEKEEKTFYYSFKNLKNNQKFIYDTGYNIIFENCQKINNKYFLAKNANNNYIIFDIFQNCGSIGAGYVPEFSTKKEALQKIKELKGQKFYKH